MDDRTGCLRDNENRKLIATKYSKLGRAKIAHTLKGYDT